MRTRKANRHSFRRIVTNHDMFVAPPAGGLGAGSSTFDASIKDIRIRLCDSERIYDTDRAGSLLDPFGVTVNMKINSPLEDNKGEIEGLEPTEADFAAAAIMPPPLALKCAIDQGITGTVSPDKLRDLLYESCLKFSFKFDLLQSSRDLTP